MIGIGIAVVVVLALLASLHLYWGFGGLWPGRDGADLSSRVAGTRSRRPASFLACSLVARALAAAAYIVGVAARIFDPLGLPDWFWTLAVTAVAGVFLLRGIAAYLPLVFNYSRGTRFYELNRRYYAPLCLLIAVGIAASTVAT